MTALLSLLLSLVASYLPFRRLLTRNALPSLQSVKLFPVINKDSSVADVAAYVEAKLQANEFAEKLCQFIIDQEIDGKCFLTLTDKELKGCGLKAGGLREELLELVEELANPRKGKDLRFLYIVII